MSVPRSLRQAHELVRRTDALLDRAQGEGEQVRLAARLARDALETKLLKCRRWEQGLCVARAELAEACGAAERALAHLSCERQRAAGRSRGSAGGGGAPTRPPGAR